MDYYDYDVLNRCLDLDSRIGFQRTYQVRDHKYATNGFLMCRVKSKDAMTQPDDPHEDRNIKKFQEASSWFESFAQAEFTTLFDRVPFGTLQYSQGNYGTTIVVAVVFDVRVDATQVIRVIETGPKYYDDRWIRWEAASGVAGVAGIPALFLRRGDVEVILASMGSIPCESC